MFALRS